MKKPSSSGTIAYTERPSDVIARAAMLASQSKRYALITSLDIKGGAARELGSLALVEENGDMHGYMSNGCIDRDIQVQAVDALRSDKKTLVRYGEGSPYLDLALPCGGALSVLIDPQPDTDAVTKAQARLLARDPASLTFTSPDESPNGGTRQFDYAPPHRLVLAGRGAIFRSMAEAGCAGGFDVHLLSPDADDLEDLQTRLSVPARHMATPQDAEDLSILDSHSAFLTLFHDHDWEPYLLKAALETHSLYIGSLGSKRTHAMRIETLHAMGASNEALSRLRGPIGLVPSLRSASFIAVSALAEVIAAMPQAVVQRA